MTTVSSNGICCFLCGKPAVELAYCQEHFDSLDNSVRSLLRDIYQVFVVKSSSMDTFIASLSQSFSLYFTPPSAIVRTAFDFREMDPHSFWHKSLVPFFAHSSAFQPLAGLVDFHPLLGMFLKSIDHQHNQLLLRVNNFATGYRYFLFLLLLRVEMLAALLLQGPDTFISTHKVIPFYSAMSGDVLCSFSRALEDNHHICLRTQSTKLDELAKNMCLLTLDDEYLNALTKLLTHVPPGFRIEDSCIVYPKPTQLAGCVMVYLIVRHKDCDAEAIYGLFQGADNLFRQKGSRLS